MVGPPDTDEAEVLGVGLTDDREQAQKGREVIVLGLLFGRGGTGAKVLGRLLWTFGGAAESFTLNI